MTSMVSQGAHIVLHLWELLLLAYVLWKIMFPENAEVDKLQTHLWDDEPEQGEEAEC